MLPIEWKKDGNNLQEPTLEFLTKIEEFKKDWAKSYKNISNENTPKIDGDGKEIIKEKGNTGQKYIIDAYMHECLDKHFPGWSWEMAAPLHFLGAEWVVAQGHLKIIDEHLLVFNVTPPYRVYYGVDSVRIQYSKDKPHTPDNIVDVGDNCKSANTAAMKVAINRLTHIGDDIYGKRIEEEGAGSLEDIMELGGSKASNAFYKKLSEKHWLIGKVKEVLKKEGIITNDISEIKDYKVAIEILEKKY
jgi:hypothetical protein